MTSLIKNPSAFGIKYFAQSSSIFDNNYDEYGPNNVFIDGESQFFETEGSPSSNQWWQVIFSAPVSISSYFLKTSSLYSYRPKSWTVKASFDNKTWQQVDAKSDVETGGNTKYFTLSHPVNCKVFRLSFTKGSNDPRKDIAFTNFDCIGNLSTYNYMTCHYYNNALRKKVTYYIILYSFCIIISLN